MQGDRKRKLNIPMYAAALLFVLVVLTVFFMPRGLRARFTTYDSSGDSARVAKWDVTAEFSGKVSEFELIDNGEKKTARCPLTVTNNSGVSISYDIILKLPVGTVVSDGQVIFTIVDTANGKTTVPKVSADKLIYTFEDVGTIAAGGVVHTTDLVITSDFKQDSAIVGIEIEVIASQID